MAVIYIRVTHKIPICNAQQQQQDVGFFSLHATKQSETDDLLYFLGKKREGFPQRWHARATQAEVRSQLLIC